MDDFIFGTLATDELRRERVNSFRSGITHNFQRFPIDPSPAQPITLHLTLGPTHPGDRAWVYWTTDGSDPSGEAGRAQNGMATPMRFAGTEWDTILWGYISHFEAALPGQPEGSLVRYRIAVWIPGRGEVYADEGKYYAFYVSDDPTPAWTQDAVVYQIFVDRFFPGEGKSWLLPEHPSGFYGGTLRGITEKLDYLAGLGINALWLTPIFPSPSHHGYDATDFTSIKDRLGTKEDLRDLLDSAHRLGIRVLLDFVPNHISSEHPAFQDAIARADSPYRDWFTFTQWPDEYETFFGVKTLPQLNLRNPAARQHVLDAAQYWLEFGVDGFRVDYAIGPTPDFWADFRRVTRSVKPDCWTFGEIVDPSDVQSAFAGQLDGALDFMLLEALRQSLAFGRWTPERLSSFLYRHEAYFPPNFSRPSFLDNHDMNRFLWATGNDLLKLKQAALCQFTLIGPPVIYYGTEVGLSQERDVRQGDRGLPEESRLPMLWDDQQDAGLREFYRNLISLRKQSQALRRGSRKTLYVNDHLLVYERVYETERLVSVLNLGSESEEFVLKDNDMQLVLASCDDCWIRLQDGKPVLILPPSGAVILQPVE